MLISLGNFPAKQTKKSVEIFLLKSKQKSRFTRMHEYRLLQLFSGFLSNKIRGDKFVRANVLNWLIGGAPGHICTP